MNYPSSHSSNSDSEWNPSQTVALQEIERQLTVKTHHLEDMATEFIREMNEGLANTNNYDRSHNLAMIPTFVTGRPTGHEKGCYLALDLGGTNLRVCLVTLKGQHEMETISYCFTISENLQHAHVRELMDFIALAIQEFIARQHINAMIVEHAQDSDILELGFTFSFPVTQTAIDAGVLLRWTKGFNCAGAVGRDVVQLLQEAFDRNQVPVHVAALINDTVGTMLAHSYKRPNTFIGAIFGTGTNGAYVENAHSISSMQDSTKEEMVVNIEWGNFDHTTISLPTTTFDRKVDHDSINPGFHIFEKMISGMYMGEICRNILVDLIDNELLLPNGNGYGLYTHWGFSTKLMSFIDGDYSPCLQDTATILEKNLEIYDSTLVDREIIQFVCRLVGLRAARLSGMAMAAVIRHGIANGSIKAPDVVYPSAGTPSQQSDEDSLPTPTSFASASSGEDEDEDYYSVASTHYSSRAIAKAADASTIHIGVDGTVFEKYPKFKENMQQCLEELLGPAARTGVQLEIARDGSGVGAALAACIEALSRKAAAKAAYASAEALMNPEQDQDVEAMQL